MMKVLLPYRFTLFSNAGGGGQNRIKVLLPYRFTLFSNAVLQIFKSVSVLLPYRFTLFSNAAAGGQNRIKFYYLIDLHYSQTSNDKLLKYIRFYYLIDLHYSQTLRSCFASAA